METPLKPPTRVIDSWSRTPEPISYDFPKSVIENAKGITLADLLDNPATQCWVISMMGNAASYAPAFASELQPEDALLLYQLNNVFQEVTPEQRQELYTQTRDFIRSRRNNA